MSQLPNLLNELTNEATVTRKYLERVPFDKKDYQPHPKSETLGGLAIHITEIIAWWKATLLYSELDFEGFTPKPIQTNQELLSYFDKLLIEAKEALNTTSEEELEKPWSMRYGETVSYTHLTLPTICSV